MAVYLYALVDRDLDVEGLTGAARERLRTVSVGDVNAVVGNVDGAPEPTREALEAQDRAVRALRDRADAVLPARFGTTYPDDDALRHAVRERVIDLLHRFDAVRGRMQMTLRILRPPRHAKAEARADADTPAAGDAPRLGTSYLKERARRAMPPAVAILADALRPVQHGARVEIGQTAGVIASMYHLVDPGEIDQYRRLVDEAAATLSGIRVVMSGPAPAYAFASLEEKYTVGNQQSRPL